MIPAAKRNQATEKNAPLLQPRCHHQLRYQYGAPDFTEEMFDDRKECDACVREIAKRESKNYRTVHERIKATNIVTEAAPNPNVCKTIVLDTADWAEASASPITARSISRTKLKVSATVKVGPHFI